MQNERPRIAIAAFTDDRDVGLYSKEVEDHIRRKQKELKDFLIENNVSVIDPLDEISSPLRDSESQGHRAGNRVYFTTGCGCRCYRSLELVAAYAGNGFCAEARQTYYVLQ